MGIEYYDWSAAVGGAAGEGERERALKVLISGGWVARRDSKPNDGKARPDAALTKDTRLDIDGLIVLLC